MVSLDHIKTSLTIPKGKMLGYWYIENKYFYPIKMWLLSFKSVEAFFRKLSGWIMAKFVNEIEHKRQIESTSKLLQDKVGTEYSTDSKFGYTGDVEAAELNCLLGYKREIDGGFKGPSESKKLYDHAIQCLSELKLSSGYKNFFNLGVAYPYIDSILAKQFSDVTFFGIERTLVPKVYNEALFSDITNLKFLSGDLFENLEQNHYEDGVFFHTRTMLLLPASFITSTYNAAKKAGFKYIVGMEQYAVSRLTGKSYDLSYEMKNSVPYRHYMMQHNYPAILKHCGYNIDRIELIKTDHPHEDFRILSFTASIAS